MKKTIYFSIILMAVLSSCKKSYTCRCFNPGGIIEEFNIRDTQKKAEERCNAYGNEHYNTIPWSEAGCSIHA